MNYWAFKCNQEKIYDLDRRLSDAGKDDSLKKFAYRVVNKPCLNDISPGDIVFICQTKAGKWKAGIRAVFAIKTYPKIKPVDSVDREYWKITPEPNEHRVDGLLTDWFRVISYQTLRDNGILNLSIYPCTRATNFEISQVAGKKIMSLILKNK